MLSGGLGSEPGIFLFRLFSISLHLTAEPQRLPKVLMQIHIYILHFYSFNFIKLLKHNKSKFK
jgi:hypothetical protein